MNVFSKNAREKIGATYDISADQCVVLLLGSVIKFPPRLIAVFQAEFPAVEFVRLDHLRDVSNTIKAIDNVQLVIIDEDFSGSICEDIEGLQKSVSGVHVALAYRDEDIAMTLLTARDRDDRFNRIGFLPLNVQMDVWLAATQLLLCGEVFYPSNLIKKMVPNRADNSAPLIENASLTPREWEVLNHISEGHQNKTIAASLGLSEHTIKLHVHNLLKKIGATNRTGAAHWHAVMTSGQTLSS